VTYREEGSMSIGTGVGLVIAGAVLYWAVELDLPYVYDNALGSIVMIAGLAVLASAVAITRASQRSVAAAIGLAVAGAFLTWVVDIDLPFVYDGALGVILLFAGVVGAIAVVAIDVLRQRSRPEVEHRYPDGSSRHHS
jgi:uncharacterized membrane protein YccC